MPLADLSFPACHHPPALDSNAPLLAHLDAQVSALRNELSTVYRTQAASQNKQLALSDALRDRDEEVRGLREEVRELREAKEAGKRREKDWEDRWKARTKDMEVSRSSKGHVVQLTTRS
jgi:chromosome segregation ATPase